MPGDRSAYAALGLEPGAEPGDIDRAYRRLIKLHHPDRDGGDSAKAAEINRAYRELRGQRPSGHAVEFHEAPGDRKRESWFPAAIVVLLAAGAMALIVTHPALLKERASRASPRHADDAASIMTRPIDGATVRASVREAISLANARGEEALLAASRDCHRRLRAHPSIARFDRCAAFDEAVVQIEDRDPMWDEGPFGAPAVARRLWSAAALLSNDYLSIDSRLDRIRLQVELLLAPRPSNASR